MNGAQVEFIGNVVRDGFERMYAANSNTPYTRVSVAVNTWRRGQEEETEFFEVTLWRGHCEAALERCGKGTQVFVRGRLNIKTYTRRDGTTAAAQVSANEFTILNRAKGAQQAAAQESKEDTRQDADSADPRPERQDMDEDDFDDIPDYDAYG